MLNSLSIKNVAVIDSLEVDMKNGLSVLTGETGAGKSIIIDSINMILGERADRELVRRGTDKAVVEAVFAANDDICKILDENDIDTEDNQVIVTRRIGADGKSVAKINGSTVTLTLLREISGMLVNIHGQHDNQALLNPAEHVIFLDEYAKNQKERDMYKKSYSRMCDIKSRLDGLNIDEQEKRRRMDLLEYQINEITAAKILPGEEEALKNQRDIYENAEKITYAVKEAYTNLYDSEERMSAYDGISIAVNALADISELNDSLKNVYTALSEAMYSVEDAAHELKNFSETVEYNEEALNDTEERLDVISKLKRKYGNSVEDILSFAKKAQNELDEINLSDEKREQLNDELEKALSEVKKCGKILSDTRMKAAEVLQQKIEKSLHELNMESAHFNIDVHESNGFSVNGCDAVEFMISTNPGEPLKPLVKIASGGELSRVMLAIKSVLAYADKVDTLIFDEIDTGVSGNAAVKIASKLKETAKTKQVICITHLPQLASAADVHYLIEKHVDSESASTTVTELDTEGRIKELSRIIDGGNAGELAYEHAREMLGIQRT